MRDAITTRILIVEDDRNLGLTLFERMEQEGFNPVLANTAAQALTELSRLRFDLCPLDVGLPDGSGFDIALQLKKTQPGTAIIFLTAQGSPENRVRGLELGAEDYVVKPFHLKELLLRVKNGLKRARYVATETANTPAEPLRLGRAEIDFSRFQAVVQGETIALSHKECALLKLLVQKRGLVISRDEILDQVWSKDEFPTPRTVDNFIMRLRRLVEPDLDNPTIIRSIRGVGYQLSQ